MKLRNSIFAKMTLSFILVISVAVSAIAFYTYARNAEMLTDRAAETNSLQLQMISDRLDAYFDLLELVKAFTYEGETQSMLARQQGESDIDRMWRLRSFQEFFSSRLTSLSLSDEIQDIIFIYPDGETLHKGKGILQAGYNFAAAPWFGQVVAQRGRNLILDTHTQPYMLSQATQGQYTISIASAVMRHINNQPLGVLLLDVSLDHFSDILAPLLVYSGSQVYFVGPEGQIVYEPSLAQIGETMPAQALEGLTEDGGGHFIASYDGADSLTTYQKSAKTGWWLVNIIPMERILADIMPLQRNLLLVALAAFLITAVLSVLFAFRVFAPLRRLTAAVNQMDDENLDFQAPVQTEDEVGVLTHAFNNMMVRIKRLIVENYAMQIKERDAQIESLQSQINPHFLFNTLESINCIAQVNEVREISVISNALARMFRYTIKDGAPFVYLSEELQHVDNFIKIQKIRFGERIKISYTVDEALLMCRTIRLILQPVIENCFKYGLEPQTDTLRISVMIYRDEGDLCIAIHDDGTGIAPERLALIRGALAQPHSTLEDTVRHIGLLNVHRRLQMHYGEGYGVSLESGYGSYTLVRLRMPCVMDG